jgi:predicted dehydrogenase
MDMQKIRVAVFGTGYWATLQIPSWIAAGADVVALWNRTRETADDVAKRFGVQRVFERPEEVFEKIDFDVADVITSWEHHKPLVLMAAKYKKPVICQKPMANTWEDCVEMVRVCENAGVWFSMHENFRYRATWRQVKEILDSGVLGKIYRGRIIMRSATPERIAGTPSLARTDHMALRDMGPHIFDVTRFLFGNAESVYCRMTSTHPESGLQDMMTALFQMKSGIPVMCELCNDQTPSAFISGSKGTLTLNAENRIIIKTGDTVKIVGRIPLAKPDYIPQASWDYHSGEGMMSIKSCVEALGNSFAKKDPSPVNAKDYLHTMDMVFKAIRSADENRAFSLE